MVRSRDIWDILKWQYDEGKLTILILSPDDSSGKLVYTGPVTRGYGPKASAKPTYNGVWDPERATGPEVMRVRYSS